MNCSTRVFATDILHHHNLVTREAAHTLFKYATSPLCNPIEIDFSCISFISRSFADQFHKLKIDLWQTAGIEIEIVNAEPDVLTMFKAVSHTQNTVERKKKTFPVLQFENNSSLEQYLHSI